MPETNARPKRVQRRRSKGWRMPQDAKYVGRPSRWGNPYRAINGTMYGPARPVEGGDLVAYSTHSAEENAVAAAIDQYRHDVDCAVRSVLTAEMIRRELAGRDLACWCRLDQPCHADVLLEIANPEAHGETTEAQEARE